MLTVLFLIAVFVSPIWFVVRAVKYSDAYGDEETALRKKFIVSGVVTGAIWLLFLWIFRPWFHGLVMPLFYIGLPITLLTLVSLGLMVYFIRKGRNWLTGVFVCVTSGLLIFAFFSGAFYKRAIYQHTEYEKVNALPNVTRIRILPLAVAKRYADDSFQESKEKMGDFSIVNQGGKLVWQAPRVPNGAVIYFTNKMGGTLELSTESSNKNIKIEKFRMEISEGVGIHDNIRFALYKERYWIHIPDSIYYLFDKEKEQRVAVVPFVKYNFAFPVMYPSFGGVFLVYEDGETIELSPKKIEGSELLKGNVVYPEWLTRKEVEAYAYHRGVVNRLFIHEDQIEIADVLEGGNPQPYLIMTEKGITWFIATEPQGKAYGIFKIFTRSASSPTGAVQIMEIPKDSSLTGPKRIVGYVRSSRNVTVPDWKSYSVIESRPFIKDNVLYWQLSIVPYSMKPSGNSSSVDYEKSFTGIFATIFVDSRTNEVYAFKSDENAIKFANGEWNMGVKSDFSNGGTIPALDKKDEVKNGRDLEERIDEIIKELERIKQELENQK